MRIEMAERNSHAARAIDLRPQLRIDFCRLRLLRYLTFEQWKVTLRIEQAGHLVFRTHRSPAEVCPLTVERQMDSQIGLRMGLSPACSLRKPGAGNQDARRGSPAVLQRGEDRSIHGMCHAEIIGVDDEQSCRSRVSKLFRNRRSCALGRIWRLTSA